MLEDFKKNTENKDFRSRLKWTPEQEAQWIKDQEAAIAALRMQAEKGDWRKDRNARSPIDTGPSTVKLDPKVGNDPLRGNRPPPPAGYADPYKKFTGGPTSEPKK